MASFPARVTLSQASERYSAARALLTDFRQSQASSLGAWLSSFSLYMFVHYERFVAGAASPWSPLLQPIPLHRPHLPSEYRQEDLESLGSFPQGGKQATSYHDATKAAVSFLVKVGLERYPDVFKVDANGDVSRLVREMTWAVSTVHLLSRTALSSNDSCECRHWQCHCQCVAAVLCGEPGRRVSPAVIVTPGACRRSRHSSRCGDVRLCVCDGVPHGGLRRASH